MVRELKGDKSGSIAIGILTSVVFSLVEHLISGLKEEMKVMHVWHNSRNYSYHIHNELREEIYKYLPKKDGHLKRVGFVFGNDQTFRSGKMLEIGIYAFLPLDKLVKEHGEERINGKTVKALAKFFVARAHSRKLDEKSIAAGKTLLDFVLTECGDGKFPDLLIAPEKTPFTGFYKNLQENENVETVRNFLRASFRGMYINSESFQRIALGNVFRKLVLEMRRKPISEEEIKEKVEKYCKKHGVEAIKIMQPKTRREDVEKDVVGRVFLLFSKKNDENLKNMTKVFMDELEEFEEIAKVKRKVPVIIDIYHGLKKDTLRSLCSAYNIEKDENQQILFWEGKLKRPENRFNYLTSIYSIYSS